MVLVAVGMCSFEVATRRGHFQTSNLERREYQFSIISKAQHYLVYRHILGTNSWPSHQNQIMRWFDLKNCLNNMLVSLFVYFGVVV